MIPSAPASASIITTMITITAMITITITTMISLLPLGEEGKGEGIRGCPGPCIGQARPRGPRLRREMADHRRGGPDRRLACAGAAGIPHVAELHDAGLARHAGDSHARQLCERLHQLGE